MGTKISIEPSIEPSIKPSIEPTIEPSSIETGLPNISNQSPNQEDDSKKIRFKNTKHLIDIKRFTNFVNNYTTKKTISTGFVNIALVTFTQTKYYTNITN